MAITRNFNSLYKPVILALVYSVLFATKTFPNLKIIYF